MTKKTKPAQPVNPNRMVRQAQHNFNYALGSAVGEVFRSQLRARFRKTRWLALVAPITFIGDVLRGVNKAAVKRRTSVLARLEKTDDLAAREVILKDLSQPKTAGEIFVLLRPFAKVSEYVQRVKTENAALVGLAMGLQQSSTVYAPTPHR